MNYTLPIDYTTLTQDQRTDVRNQYVREQNELCYYCKGSLNESPPKNITDMEINWVLFLQHFYSIQFIFNIIITLE